MGRARMTRRMVCNDRTAGLGLEWSAAGLSDCGFAEGAGDAVESVAGDQIAGTLYCGLELRNGADWSCAVG